MTENNLLCAKKEKKKCCVDVLRATWHLYLNFVRPIGFTVQCKCAWVYIMMFLCLLDCVRGLPPPPPSLLRELPPCCFPLWAGIYCFQNFPVWMSCIEGASQAVTCKKPHCKCSSHLKVSHYEFGWNETSWNYALHGNLVFLLNICATSTTRIESWLRL